MTDRAKQKDRDWDKEMREVDRLLAQQSRLESQRQELLSSLNRLGREPAIRKQAIDLGLFPLAKPVVVRSR